MKVILYSLLLSSAVIAGAFNAAPACDEGHGRKPIQPFDQLFEAGCVAPGDEDLLTWPDAPVQTSFDTSTPTKIASRLTPPCSHLHPSLPCGLGPTRLLELSNGRTESPGSLEASVEALELDAGVGG